MNVKIKIALNGIAQKLSRQSITAEQAAAHFKKVTGEDLADFIEQADPEVGKFLAYLGGAYPIPEAQLSEAEPNLVYSLEDPETEADGSTAPQDPETEAAPAVTEERPKRTRKPAEAK